MNGAVIELGRCRPQGLDESLRRIVASGFAKQPDRLHPADIEAIAEAVAQKLAAFHPDGEEL